MNIYDIAKKANVSPATVSRVLNGNQSVREKTRKKVQQIIDESNYVPNSLARSLSVGDIRNIAFLAPDIENSFFSKILHGLSDTASQYDYNVFMYGTNDIIVSVIGRHAFDVTDLKSGINLERIIVDMHIIVRYRK